jgi:hypothetical protein
MTAVNIRERKIWVGDTSIHLLGGEVHFWRLNPAHWRTVLRRVKDLGVSVVATYVCWDFHELEPGRYDFTGETDPACNLLGFLDLVAEENLWVILRPGPYIYAEWRNNGVPDRAACYHRASEAFRLEAAPYMDAVTQLMRPYLASNGGRIILWQADNEIDPWPHLYTEQLGLGRHPGPFQDFLRLRYPDIAALNEAWRTNYEMFEQARAVSHMIPEDPIMMARYNDYRTFLHAYVTEVASWSADFYRARGVDVPILLNTYSGVGTQRWADMEKLADLVGPDIYPSREYIYRPGEQRHILEAIRYTRAYSQLPYIPEYESGIWHDWLEDVGALTPKHYRLLCTTALQGGAAGWNWYMLVNRDNWYQSPINEWGRARAGIFEAFQQMTALYHQLDPTTLEPVTTAAVTFDPLQRATDRPGRELLQALYNADIDYDFFDLTGPESQCSMLFYAGGAWLSAEGQMRLAHWVEQGGHLVCVGTVPRLDEHYQPLALLDPHLPSGNIGADVRLSIFDGQVVDSPWFYNYHDVPGEPIVASRMPLATIAEELRLQFDLENGAEYTVGYTVERGKGRLTVVGLAPSAGVLLAILGQFGVAVPCRSLTTGITSALFRRGDTLYVVVTNVGEEDRAAEILFDRSILDGVRWDARDLITGRESTVDERGILTVALPRKDGAVVEMKLAP